MYMSQEPSIQQEMRHTSAWMKHWTAGNHFRSISKTRPSPAREGRPIGSAGPTTASRMDKYAPRLLDLGQTAMIGKGKRSQAVINAVVRNGCVYLAAIGGAGALLSKCIKSSEIIAYEDLGTEAIRKLQVENLPLIVVIDSEGNNLYETAIKEYAKI